MDDLGDCLEFVEDDEFWDEDYSTFTEAPSSYAGREVWETYLNTIDREVEA